MHTSEPSTRVGRVAGLWRYPVKSMRGEPLAAADVSWHGLAGDRRWAFVRSDAANSGFPWLTLRERGDMGQYRPSFVEPSRPDRSPTVVLTPSGRTLEVSDPALAAELYPVGAQAIKQDRGSFDTFPLSLITTQTIGALEHAVGVELATERFRPNILVTATTSADFPEDSWVGSVLRIGNVRMRIDKRDGRCAVITIDPESTERDPEILRAVARDRQGCLGVYGSTVEAGRIALSDPVFVEVGRQ